MSRRRRRRRRDYVVVHAECNPCEKQALVALTIRSGGTALLGSHADQEVFDEAVPRLVLKWSGEGVAARRAVKG